MPSANDALLDSAVAHQIGIQRFSSSTSNKLIALLNRIDADLVRQLLKLDPTAVTSTWSEKRLEKLLAAIREINREAYRTLGRELRRDLIEFAQYEIEYQTKAIQSASGIKLDIVTPSLEQLRAAVDARPFQGRLLKEALEGLEASRAAKIRDAVRMGFVEGETIDQMVRRIRGTKALKYTDGVLEIGRREAQALIRTAVNHTANFARQELYAANADIVKGWKFVATLDARTTATCRALDSAGKVYPVGEGPMPPRHYGCRSTSVSLLKSWRDLGIDADDIPPSTRASMDGQVPADLTYNDWLKRRSAAEQDEILGKAKGKLFRAGVSVDRFVDRSGNELTLPQLREKESAAWKRAGLGG